jgi:hypothetical protein
MGLGGPETKNYCTGDGRQQFTRPGSRQKNVVMGPVSPGVKNDRAGETSSNLAETETNKP